MITNHWVGQPEWDETTWSESIWSESAGNERAWRKAVRGLGHRRGEHGPLRIALYSHDTVGLGHTRRNLLIAERLSAAFPAASILLVTGAHLSGAFALPERVDLLTLPALHKNAGGDYEAKRLELELADLVALRREIILAALGRFAPQLLLVDNVPRGALGELEPVLLALRARGGTRCALGLRDILDEPAALQREWRERDNDAAVARFYDAVFVYGDRRVNDLAASYGFASATAAKLVYTGYLDPRARAALGDGAHGTGGLEEEPGEPFALGLVGGGQDGAALALAFAEAATRRARPSVLVSGPYLPLELRRRLAQLAAEHPQLRVHDFVAEPTRLLALAERVVTMGGYNSLAEVLAFGKRALVVPRVKPRREQLIRAERLAALGLVEWLHPDALSADALHAWLEQPLEPVAELPSALEQLDFGGLERLPGLLGALLSNGATEGEVLHAAG